jgi:hypothetical protein
MIYNKSVFLIVTRAFFCLFHTIGNDTSKSDMATCLFSFTLFQHTLFLFSNTRVVTPFSSLS